jgi:hypothetical protein
MEFLEYHKFIYLPKIHDVITEGEGDLHQLILIKMDLMMMIRSKDYHSMMTVENRNGRIVFL